MRQVCRRAAAARMFCGGAAHSAAPVLARALTPWAAAAVPRVDGAIRQRSSGGTRNGVDDAKRRIAKILQFVDSGPSEPAEQWVETLFKVLDGRAFKDVNEDELEKLRDLLEEKLRDVAVLPNNIQEKLYGFLCALRGSVQASGAEAFNLRAFIVTNLHLLRLQPPSTNRFVALGDKLKKDAAGPLFVFPRAANVDDHPFSIVVSTTATRSIDETTLKNEAYDIKRRFFERDVTPQEMLDFGVEFPAGRVVAVRGSSGAGKTYFALRTGNPLVVVYVCGMPGIESTLDKQQRDKLSYEAATACLENAKLVLEAADVDQDKLMELVRDGPTHNKETSHWLRIVFDEAGAAPLFTRGAISVQKAIFRTAAELFFPSVKSDAEVHISMAIAGTGTASPSKIGSMPSKFTVIDMDDYKDKFRGKCKHWLPPNVQSALDETKLRSPMAARFDDLLSSARLGMMLVILNSNLSSLKTRREHLPTQGNKTMMPYTDGLPASALIEATAFDAIGTFLGVNGMQDYVNDRDLHPVLVQLLIHALAIDVGCYDRVEEPLRASLVQECGLLVDRAREMKKIDKGWCKIETVEVGRRTKRNVVVPDDGRGRYVMPPAMRALALHMLFHRIDDTTTMVDGLADWAALEVHLCRWVAVLQLCVTEHRTLRDLVELSKAPHITGSYELPSPPPPNATPTGTAMRKPADSHAHLARIRRQNPPHEYTLECRVRRFELLPSTRGTVIGTPRFPPNPDDQSRNVPVHIEHLTHKFPRDSADRPSGHPPDHFDLLLSGKDCAVAWINGIGAPYADVIAVSNAFGRRELLLLQPKLRQSKKEIDLDEEAAKCALVRDVSGPQTAAARARMERFRDVQRDTPTTTTMCLVAVLASDQKRIWPESLRLQDDTTKVLTIELKMDRGVLRHKEEEGCRAFHPLHLLRVATARATRDVRDVEDADEM